uniref:Uncharacterized protein n=1 Tax=Arundo donax TaxID=35708 RepID=A0A0A9ECQ4_ARUDO
MYEIVTVLGITRRGVVVVLALVVLDQFV